MEVLSYLKNLYIYNYNCNPIFITTTNYRYVVVSDCQYLENLDINIDIKYY